MEIADNQHHPIDLSRKCAYYDQPQRYASRSTAVTSSRPLPDLIPISLLHNAAASSKPRKDAASPLLDCVQSCNQSLLGFQFKERSTARKELSRQRSISRSSSTTAGAGSKMRKSASETGLPFMRTDGVASRATASTNYLSVPMYRSVAAAATSSVSRPAKYADHDGGRVYESSCFAPTYRFDSRHGDDEVSSSSVHTHSKKYVKQGPGVSLSTIQSLRKMLDKRKSMQKDT